VASKKRRGSLREAFGEDSPRGLENQSIETVNTVKEAGTGERGPIARTGEVEMVPGGRSGEMVPADKPVNMTFTVTAKERYLWTLELRRRGRSAVSVLRERMNELVEERE
jgi:hypothetical protein